MRGRVKKWTLTLVKIAIAIMALWVVVWAPWRDEPAIVWRDRVTLQAGKEIHGVEFLEQVQLWKVVKPDLPLARADNVAVALVTFSDRPVRVKLDGREQSLALTDPRIRAVFAPAGIAPAEGVARFSLARWFGSLREQHPQIDIPQAWLVPGTGGKKVGLRTLLRTADPWLLIGSWAVLVIPFLVSAYRWRRLMQPQGVRLPFSKCLALTFVGQFYSTMIPGTTGGDLVKIVYTSRVTGSKTKSAVTILLDRAMGLTALMVIGGLAAALQARGNPTMRNVALLIGAIFGGLIGGAIVYFSHRLRRLCGLEWLLARPFVPAFVRHVDEVLHLYRGHLWVLVEAVAISLITMVVVPLSAWLAGMALGINLGPGHYLAFVPVAILVQAVPVTPQGIGTMDWVVDHFFVARGNATSEQAIALAQAIRLLPIFWNLVGAYWVITGVYTRKEAIREEAEGEGEETVTP